MALANSTSFANSIGGALVGSRVSDIFQHFFAMSEQDGDGNKTSSTNLSDALPHSPAEPIYSDRKINHPGELTNPEIQAITDLLQDRLPNHPIRRKNNVTTVTVTSEGRVVISKNGGKPSDTQIKLANEIFGEGNVDIVQGRGRNAPGDNGHHAEPRGLRAIEDVSEEIPGGTRQGSSHYACVPCEGTQNNANVINITGTKTVHGTIQRPLDHLNTPIPKMQK
jgi:hypothetical protein